MRSALSAVATLVFFIVSVLITCAANWYICGALFRLYKFGVFTVYVSPWVALFCAPIAFSLFFSMRRGVRPDTLAFAERMSIAANKIGIASCAAIVFLYLADF
jgi:hypothetical protein